MTNFVIDNTPLFRVNKRLQDRIWHLAVSKQPNQEPLKGGSGIFHGMNRVSPLFIGMTGGRGAARVREIHGKAARLSLGKAVGRRDETGK